MAIYHSSFVTVTVEQGAIVLAHEYSVAGASQIYILSLRAPPFISENEDEDLIQILVPQKHLMDTTPYLMVASWHLIIFLIPNLLSEVFLFTMIIEAYKFQCLAHIVKISGDYINIW